jgi:hypothetical protein
MAISVSLPAAAAKPSPARPGYLLAIILEWPLGRLKCLSSEGRLILGDSRQEYRGEGEEVRFATDSPVEGQGFEPSISLKRDPDRADVFG